MNKKVNELFEATVIKDHYKKLNRRTHNLIKIYKIIQL